MPTLSASDYTQYLKFKAAAASPIKPAIQTRDNVATSQSLINANVLASQAAYVVTPTTTVVNTATVTGALTNVLSAVVDAGSSGYQYTSSQPHGLIVGQTVTITGFTGTLSPTPNVTKTVNTVIDDTNFVLIGFASPTGTATGTGSITGRVYYTTSGAHGMTTSDTATVTNITTFTALGATVLAVPSTTTFVLDSSTTGTAVTGASGILSFPRVNQLAAVSGLARVQARQVVQTRSNPDARATLSFAGTSGALSSSRVQQPGGLPTGFKNSQGTYTRLPQNAGWSQGGAGNVSSGPKRF